MSDPSAPTPVPSPWDLRADLVGRVAADLLGPLDGENEVIRGYQLESGRWSSPGRVRDRYLVGMLAPKGTIAADPERDDDVGPEEGDDTGGGVQDGRIPRMVMAQSSMGLSVVVDGAVDRLVARCRWGQYLREFENQDDGSRAPVWVRRPQEIDVVVPLADGEFGPLPVNAEPDRPARSSDPLGGGAVAGDGVLVQRAGAGRTQQGQPLAFPGPSRLGRSRRGCCIPRPGRGPRRARNGFGFGTGRSRPTRLAVPRRCGVRRRAWRRYRGRSLRR